jgi:hypothetical protein
MCVMAQNTSKHLARQNPREAPNFLERRQDEVHRCYLLVTRAELFRRCRTRRKPRHIGQTVHTRGSDYATCYALRPFAAHRRKGRGLGTPLYCLRTADKVPDVLVGGFPFLRVLQVQKRADERTRTADLPSLRMIHQALQGVAHLCKFRLSKPLSLLQFATCCTVLRSRWCRSGVGVVLTFLSGEDPSFGNKDTSNSIKESSEIGSNLMGAVQFVPRLMVNLEPKEAWR